MVAMLALLAAIAGCDGEGGPAEPPDLAWRVVLDDLDGAILSLWGPSSRELFAVGGGLGPDGRALVLRHDGASWRRLDLDAPTLWWVFGWSTEEVWAVGERGTVVRWNGSEWTALESGTGDTLWGVWGASPDDVWIVGGDPLTGGAGVLRHWDGETFEQDQEIDTEREMFFKVWGTAADDVYVVGIRGTILHWDGAAWARMQTPTEDRLVTVTGRGPGDVWVVGGLGSPILLHLEDGAWSALEDVDLYAGLMGVWTAPGEPFLVTGWGGFLALGNEAGITLQSSPTLLDLHTAWSDGEVFLAGGGDLDGVGTPSGTLLAAGDVAEGPIEEP